MKSSKEKKLTIVIGASRLGASIASYNSQNGIYTVIIDKQQPAFRKLDANYSGYKIEGDAEELDILEEANIKEATEVDILTHDDNVNIYIANVVLQYYTAPLVLVRLMDASKSVFLDSPRIRIISPSILSFRNYKEIIENKEKEDKEIKEDEQ